MEYYVYILECSDGTFYTGITSDMAQRLDAHNDDAFHAEHQIKGWSRKKKQALIENDGEPE